MECGAGGWNRTFVSAKVRRRSAIELRPLSETAKHTPISFLLKARVRRSTNLNNSAVNYLTAPARWVTHSSARHQIWADDTKAFHRPHTRAFDCVMGHRYLAVWCLDSALIEACD